MMNTFIMLAAWLTTTILLFKTGGRVLRRPVAWWDQHRLTRSDRQYAKRPTNGRVE